LKTTDVDETSTFSEISMLFDQLNAVGPCTICWQRQG